MKRGKRKQTLIKEVERLKNKFVISDGKMTTLFNTYRRIDFLVEYLKNNKDDQNAVIEAWIRKNISDSRILDFYRTKMNKEIPNYRSIVGRMMSVNAGTTNVRMQMRIEAFQRKIQSFINGKENKQNNSGLIPITDSKKKSNFDILNKKDWMLDWNCVTFKKGSVVIFSRSDLGFKFKPTEVDAPRSLESFNYLKKYLNERLPPVRCVIEGLKLTVVDKINFNDAILYFAAASRQSGIKINRSNSNIITPRKMSFDQALSKAQNMTPEEFKKYKSEYIDFLVSKQCRDYKVIPCIERMVHTNTDETEYAFMFTLRCKSGKILIIHENVNPDRSTLLFVVNESDYMNSIRSIYNFLQSAEINKRSSLRRGEIDKENAGVISYRSINHEDIYSWRFIINRCINYMVSRLGR